MTNPRAGRSGGRSICEKPFDLSGCQIRWPFDGKSYRYKVEGSADRKNWSLLSDQTKTTATSQVHDLKFQKARQVRYVKITVTGLDEGCWASICEVKVFGSRTASRSTMMKVAVPFAFLFLCAACGPAMAAGAVQAQHHLRPCRRSGHRRRQLLRRRQAPDAAHRRPGGIRPALPDVLRSALVRAVALPADDRALCLSHRRVDQPVVARRRAGSEVGRRIPHGQAPEAGRLCHRTGRQMAAVGRVAGRLGF